MCGPARNALSEAPGLVAALWKSYQGYPGSVDPCTGLVAMTLYGNAVGICGFYDRRGVCREAVLSHHKNVPALPFTLSQCDSQ